MALELMTLPPDRLGTWRAAARGRLIATEDAAGLRTGADAVEHVDRLLGRLQEDAGRSLSRVIEVSVDRVVRGTIWLAGVEDKMFVLDVDVPTTVARDLFPLVEEIARVDGATSIVLALHPSDAAGHALIADRGFRLASIQMLLAPLPTRAADDRVRVSAMTPERFVRFVEHSERAFADDLVASGRYTRAQADAESHRQIVLELPDGLATAGQSFFVATVDDAEVGSLWLGARLRDDRPHGFVLDVEVVESQRRRGYGRALMLAAEREAAAFGAESLGLHVFGFNTGAIDLYEGLGYRRLEESYYAELHPGNTAEHGRLAPA